MLLLRGLRGGGVIGNEFEREEKEEEYKKILREGQGMVDKAIKLGLMGKEQPKNLTKLDKRYLKSLRVLKKRQKELAAERRGQAIMRRNDTALALEQQRIIFEGRTDEFYKLTSFGRHEEKLRRSEELQRNRTAALSDVLVDEYKRRAALNISAALTEEEVMSVVERAYSKPGCPRDPTQPI